MHEPFTICKPYGLAVILLFIGAKMLLVDFIKIPVLVSLGFVVAVLAITMLWSVRTAPRFHQHSQNVDHSRQ